jgi:hypothetical protein
MRCVEEVVSVKEGSWIEEGMELLKEEEEDMGVVPPVDSRGRPMMEDTVELLKDSMQVVMEDHPMVITTLVKHAHPIVLSTHGLFLNNTLLVA